MNRKILFSPVGGTDPISSTNFRDGSMLHICRVYQPQVVILYMSKEMIENHEKDNRYLYCLEKLARRQSRKMEYQIIQRLDLTEVQEFDYFYRDFRKIIADIFQRMDETDQLLLNISSGTPAMKSGLAVLQTIGEFPCKMIQVSTPERRMTEHIHRGYDVELLWEVNEDNEEGFENRCREIKCPTLSALKNEEIIKKHISVYDYQAAYDVAASMPLDYVSSYIDLLKMGACRMLFDFSSVNKIMTERNLHCLPVRGGDSLKYFEYALNLKIKLLRKEYADFVRGITPLIVDLFEMVLKKQAGIDINKYCDKDRNNEKNRYWSRTKLQRTEVLNIFNEEYRSKGGFGFGYVYSDHLRRLIVRKSSDQKLKQLVENVRNVEMNIRNLAAHNIVSITDVKIKSETGFTGEQIMNMIKKLFLYTEINIKPEYWDSYDDMNRMILAAMEKGDG